MIFVVSFSFDGLVQTGALQHVGFKMLSQRFVSDFKERTFHWKASFGWQLRGLCDVLSYSIFRVFLIYVLIPLMLANWDNIVEWVRCCNKLLVLLKDACRYFIQKDFVISELRQKRLLYFESNLGEVSLDNIGVSFKWVPVLTGMAHPLHHLRHIHSNFRPCEVLVDVLNFF